MCVNIGKPVNTNATRGDRCHEFMKHWEKELGSHAPIKRKNDERPQKAKVKQRLMRRMLATCHFMTLYINLIEKIL